MIAYLMIVLITSCWVCGLQIASQPDMVLNKPALWLEKKWPGNPVLACRWCMASVHTVVVMLLLYFLLGEIQYPLKKLIGLYLLSVPAASFLGGSLFSLVLCFEKWSSPAEVENDEDRTFNDFYNL